MKPIYSGHITSESTPYIPSRSSALSLASKITWVLDDFTRCLEPLVKIIDQGVNQNPNLAAKVTIAVINENVYPARYVGITTSTDQISGILGYGTVKHFHKVTSFYFYPNIGLLEFSNHQYPDTYVWVFDEKYQKYRYWDGYQWIWRVKDRSSMVLPRQQASGWVYDERNEKYKWVWEDKRQKSLSRPSKSVSGFCFDERIQTYNCVRGRKGHGAQVRPKKFEPREWIYDEIYQNYRYWNGNSWIWEGTGQILRNQRNKRASDRIYEENEQDCWNGYTGRVLVLPRYIAGT